MLKMIKLNLRSLRYQHLRRWVWWFRQMIHSCLIKRLEALRKGRGTSYIWKLSEGRETRGEEKWYSTWWHGSKERTGHTSLSCSRNHWKWRWFNFSRTLQVFYQQLLWWMIRFLQSRLSSFKSASTHVLACKVQEDQWTAQRSLVHWLWQAIDGSLHCQT